MVCQRLHLFGKLPFKLRQNISFIATMHIWRVYGYVLNCLDYGWWCIVIIQNKWDTVDHLDRIRGVDLNDWIIDAIYVRGHCCMIIHVHVGYCLKLIVYKITKWDQYSIWLNISIYLWLLLYLHPWWLHFV